MTEQCLLQVNNTDLDCWVLQTPFTHIKVDLNILMLCIMKLRPTIVYIIVTIY